MDKFMRVAKMFLNKFFAVVTDQKWQSFMLERNDRSRTSNCPLKTFPIDIRKTKRTKKIHWGKRSQSDRKGAPKKRFIGCGVKVLLVFHSKLIFEH